MASSRDLVAEFETMKVARASRGSRQDGVLDAIGSRAIKKQKTAAEQEAHDRVSLEEAIRCCTARSEIASIANESIFCTASCPKHGQPAKLRRW